jgi:hypothetical protein
MTCRQKAPLILGGYKTGRINPSGKKVAYLFQTFTKYTFYRADTQSNLNGTSAKCLKEGGMKLGPTKSSQKGLQEGWTRATFILRDDHLEKLKALAYWERKKIKEVIGEAFSSYLKGKRIKSKRNFERGK